MPKSFFSLSRRPAVGELDPWTVQIQLIGYSTKQHVSISDFSSAAHRGPLWRLQPAIHSQPC
jgi:hypothetical protein